jgi:PST family polysaccharide transporter
MQPDPATYYLERLLGVLSLIFVPVMVGVAAVSEPLVLGLFGEKWAPSAMPLAIMSLGMLFRLNTSLLKSAMSGMGRAELILKSSALQFALLLPMIMYAVDYGVIGLVLAGVANELLVAMATVRWGRHVFNITFASIFRCYLPALVSTSIMALFVLGIKHVLMEQGEATILAAQVLVGTVSYIVAVRFLYPTAFKIAWKTVFGDRLQSTTRIP